MISDSYTGTIFYTADIQNPMKIFSYIKLPLKYLTDEIKQEYDINNIAKDALKITAFLNPVILKNLAISGYYYIQFTTGLWQNTLMPIMFTLCVDNFGVIYKTKEGGHYLLDVSRTKYEILTDMPCTDYLGLTKIWNHKGQFVDASMLGYISKG